MRPQRPKSLYFTLSACCSLLFSCVGIHPIHSSVANVLGMSVSTAAAILSHVRKRLCKSRQFVFSCSVTLPRFHPLGLLQTPRPTCATAVVSSQRTSTCCS